MKALTEDERYERYRAYCALIGAPTHLSQDSWRRESAKIPDLHFMGITHRCVQPDYPVSSARLILVNQ